MSRSRSHRHQVLHRRRKRRIGRLAAVAAVLSILPGRIGPPEPVRSAGLHAAAGGLTQPPLRSPLIASPFGTIHAATFRFAQPVGTEVPAVPADPAAYTTEHDVIPPFSEDPPWTIQHVDRRLKGPRLTPRMRPDPNAPRPAALVTDESGSAESIPSPQPDLDGSRGMSADASGESSASHEATDANAAPADAAPVAPELPRAAVASIADVDATARMARIYFATVSLGVTPAAPEPWPSAVFEPDAEDGEATPLPADPSSAQPGNATIAAKGEVTGADHRPKSPAELLDLEGADRARHEKCLADAIYFEARGEPVRGQMAVAQVVMNRVFSGYYPHNVCGVVYQNTRRHRHVRCQFSFTCDHVPDRITEPDAWDRARRIAREALDGDFWLNDIGKATHYHARWVHPWWVREMRKLDRIGVHTFYRPRKWGDGDKSPIWGDANAKL